MIKLILLFFLADITTIATFGQRRLNDTLVRQLDTILTSDQMYREQIRPTRSKYGVDSKEAQELFEVIRKIDSINLIKVEAIIDKYGWLGPDVLGEDGSHTLFLILQHSDLTTQEKYLPIMRTAVKNGNVTAKSLALLEDRIALAQGKNQIYGTQVGTYLKTNESFVFPIEDPDNVDKRRSEMGLPPLSVYLSKWQIIWDIEQYKKNLPRIKAFLQEDKH